MNIRRRMLPQSDDGPLFHGFGFFEEAFRNNYWKWCGIMKLESDSIRLSV